MGALSLAIAFVVLAVGGCGSDSDSGSSGTLTKAQFIVRADAICQQTDKRQAARFKTYVKENGEATSPAGEEEIVKEVGLPEIEAEIEELRELDPPAGEEEKVGTILDQADAALKQAEDDPGSVLQKAGDPFNEVEKLAKEFGFKQCGLV